MVRGRRKPSGAAGLANIPKDELAVISAADAAGLCDAVFGRGIVSNPPWVMAESQGTIRTPPMACIR
jgi:hypothetical protein